MEPPFKQVTAAIIERDDHFFVAQRQLPEDLDGKWEFPGGKQEPGEDLFQCVIREMSEEFGIEIEVIRPFMSVPYKTNSGGIVLVAMMAKIVSGEPAIATQEHSDCQWIHRSKLLKLDLLPADIPIAAALQTPV